MFLNGKTFTCCAFGVNNNSSIEHHFVSMLGVCLEKMGTASKKKNEVFLRCSWPKMLWTFVAWWLIFSLSESDRVYFPDSLLGRKMVGAICWDAPRIRWLFSSDEVKVKDCRIQPMSWCFSWWVEPGPNESLMKKDSYSKYEPIHSNYISIATRHEFRVLFSTIQS